MLEFKDEQKERKLHRLAEYSNFWNAVKMSLAKIVKCKKKDDNSK